MMYYGGMNTGWFLFCTLAVIAIIALVAWAIVSTTSRRAPRDTSEATRDDALSTLRRRFASGEIDEQEYERRRNLLTQH